jgi:hypothetical protein
MNHCCPPLRKCNTHGIPVNHCPDCWPRFLAYLGALCAKAVHQLKPGDFTK